MGNIFSNWGSKKNEPAPPKITKKEYEVKERDKAKMQISTAKTKFMREIKDSEKKIDSYNVVIGKVIGKDKDAALNYLKLRNMYKSRKDDLYKKLIVLQENEHDIDKIEDLKLFLNATESGNKVMEEMKMDKVFENAATIIEDSQNLHEELKDSIDDALAAMNAHSQNEFETMDMEQLEADLAKEFGLKQPQQDASIQLNLDPLPEVKKDDGLNLEPVPSTTTTATHDEENKLVAV
mmetsp:Transcript_14306/g.21625  ORF Transcript_14306/g.21625 Transcript_14306/m.21625 type:complete len:236 (-) Transcript_14306:16-723(-)